MRDKTALLVATAVLFLTAGWASDCLAESGLAGASNDERAAVEVAAPLRTDQVDVQPEVTAENSGGNARPEAAEPTNKRPGQRSSSKVGIAVKVSTLGAGIEAAVPLLQKANLRGAVNMFQYNRTITNDGIHYNGQLHFRSGEAHFDWFPFGGFHISPGVLFYNGNQLTANASVPGGQIFTVGGTSYESDPAAPVTGTGNSIS